MKITLKAARVNAEMTQKEAAEHIGVTEYTIFNWEKRKSFPSIKYLQKIEQVYQVQYADLSF